MFSWTPSLKWPLGAYQLDDQGSGLPFGRALSLGDNRTPVAEADQGVGGALRHLAAENCLRVSDILLSLQFSSPDH